ncbi:ectoine/hydroxyectoine ABC transporter substrate-binding protein EhuB [Mesorhizobium sp. M0960]|uniref:ectoine/hydroxyectoine ABC transporter substrate-binding protein EhuB n=1 Tax=Mesorhizobium sp. M0960 TaxID=2957035 RepID=UPI003334B6E9
MGLTALGIAMMAVGLTAGSASAKPLLERIRDGDTIRLGFSNGPPFAYLGENNELLGFGNAITLDILKKMGTTKGEAVISEWGALIPGLQAGRLDLITGGMYIKPERCRNVLFSEPFATDEDALIVPKGNPKGLHSLADIRDKGLTLVTGSGYATVKVAQDMGFADEKLMQVAGNSEIAQAIKAGRAAGGSVNYLDGKTIVKTDPSIELADPYTSSGPKDYAAIAFPPNEQTAVDAFNAVLKDYLGSDEMMALVGKYGYDKTTLPDGPTTAEICKR